MNGQPVGLSKDTRLPSEFDVTAFVKPGANRLVAVVVTWLTRGDVAVLVVLYSINVFITFSLSQLGMVRHWW